MQRNIFTCQRHEALLGLVTTVISVIANPCQIACSWFVFINHVRQTTPSGKQNYHNRCSIPYIYGLEITIQSYSRAEVNWLAEDNQDETRGKLSLMFSDTWQILSLLLCQDYLLSSCLEKTQFKKHGFGIFINNQQPSS